MLLKIVKYNNLIYQNADTETISNFPSDFASLQSIALETVRWLAGQKIFAKLSNDPTKRNTALTKSITLVVKVISTLIAQNNLTFDTTALTANELTIWNTLLALANNGYSDSPLTAQSVTTIQDTLTWYQDQVTTINGFTEADQILDYLANIDISGLF